MVRQPGYRLTMTPPPAPEPALRLGKLMGERLRERRTELGLSLSETARRASVSASYLAAVESAASTPSLPVLSRIAHALGLTLGEVIAMDDGGIVRRDRLDDTPGVKVVSAPDLGLAVAFDVYRPGQTGSCPVACGDSDVVLFVRAGGVDATVDGDSWQLDEGDALQSPGSATITCQAGPAGATLVWASAPRYAD